MKTRIQALVACVLFLIVGLLIWDYLNLRQQVANLNALHQQGRAADKKRDDNLLKNSVPTQSYESRSITRQGEKEPPETFVLGGISIKVSDTAIIFLTALIALFTGGLFLEEKDRSRKELRAYLGLGGGKVFKLPNNILRGVVEIKNFGETPAHNVMVAIAGELRAPGDQRPFNDPDFIPHRQPIAPTMSWTFGHEFLEMTDQDLNDVLANKKLVYIWGHVKYQDIYNESRIFRFRLRNVVKILVTTEDGTTAIKEWKFYPEDEGNEAS